MQDAGAGNSFLRVIAPTALALLLCNMDRIVMSVAIVPIAKEFAWTPSVQASCYGTMFSRGSHLISEEAMQGVVQSAFLWGYMGTNVLGGKLADVYGGNPVNALHLTCSL